METINKALRSDLHKIDPRSIRVIEGFNPRKDYGDIDELAKSIAENGIKNPLSGYKKVENGEDIYYLTDGHRRLKATLLAIENGAEIARVPFILESKTYTDTERLCDTIVKNDGKNLTQYEQAIVFDKLINTYNWTSKEVSIKLGKQQSFICNTLKLLELPEDVQVKISENEISATAALAIAGTTNDDKEVSDKVIKAVKVAKESGKQKATAKHIEQKTETIEEVLKKQLKAILLTLAETSACESNFYEIITDTYTSLQNGETLEMSLALREIENV